MSTQVIGLILLTLGVLVGTWLAVQFARALVRRLAQALRLPQRGAELQQLRARARARVMPPGPRRELAAMRSQLLAELNHTQRVLTELATVSEVLVSYGHQLRAACARTRCYCAAPSSSSTSSARSTPTSPTVSSPTRSPDCTRASPTSAPSPPPYRSSTASAGAGQPGSDLETHRCPLPAAGRGDHQLGRTGPLWPRLVPCRATAWSVVNS